VLGIQDLLHIQGFVGTYMLIPLLKSTAASLKFFYLMLHVLDCLKGAEKKRENKEK
jgi:hypothetical protein